MPVKVQRNSCSRKSERRLCVLQTTGVVDQRPGLTPSALTRWDTTCVPQRNIGQHAWNDM